MDLSFALLSWARDHRVRCGRLALVGLLGAVVIADGACSSTAEDPTFVLAPVPNTPASLQVEVGTGAVTFTPLAENDPVDLTYGPQGGFHIWTAVRIKNTTARSVQVNLRAVLDDGTLAGPPSHAAAPLEVQADGTSVAVGLRNFIENTAEKKGRRLTLKAEVIASDQTHGAGERTVLVR